MRPLAAPGLIASSASCRAQQSVRCISSRVGLQISGTIGNHGKSAWAGSSARVVRKLSSSAPSALGREASIAPTSGTLFENFSTAAARRPHTVQGSFVTGAPCALLTRSCLAHRTAHFQVCAVADDVFRRTPADTPSLFSLAAPFRAWRWRCKSSVPAESELTPMICVRNPLRRGEGYGRPQFRCWTSDREKVRGARPRRRSKRLPSARG